jgi:NAD-dependent dihydropyrimidine dehydrogenase PreA subunit
MQRRIRHPGRSDEKATYIWIDSNPCIRCRACPRIRPVEAISLRKANVTFSCGSR